MKFYLCFPYPFFGFCPLKIKNTHFPDGICLGGGGGIILNYNAYDQKFTQFELSKNKIKSQHVYMNMTCEYTIDEERKL